MRPRTIPSPPPWQVYFTDFAVPKAVLDLVHLGEAIDTSSPNDNSPSFSTADMRVQVFVDHPDPSKRELGEAPRYFVLCLSGLDLTPARADRARIVRATGGVPQARRPSHGNALHHSVDATTRGNVWVG